MKIYQLFIKKVELDVLMDVLSCFGISDLSDKRLFSKIDIQYNETVRKLEELKPILTAYYLPCKAKVYLEGLTEKRAVTVLKQILRLHGYYLLSKERNVNNRKIIYYQLINEKDKQTTTQMRKFNVTNVMKFD